MALQLIDEKYQSLKHVHVTFLTTQSSPEIMITVDHKPLPFTMHAEYVHMDVFLKTAADLKPLYNVSPISEDFGIELERVSSISVTRENNVDLMETHYMITIVQSV